MSFFMYVFGHDFDFVLPSGQLLIAAKVNRSFQYNVMCTFRSPEEWFCMFHKTNVFDFWIVF